jgi:predicted nucleic acid-binding protein
MIVVVADTSPIRYLVRIGEIDLLPRLYAGIIIPPAVREELEDQGGLPLVRAWAEDLPPWIQVESPAKLLDTIAPNLHRGERDAIALAEQLQAKLLLIDDRAGARVAAERGLPTTGTLGVLVEAAQAGLTRIDVVLPKLRSTNFRATPELYQRAWELARQDSSAPDN